MIPMKYGMKFQGWATRARPAFRPLICSVFFATGVFLAPTGLRADDILDAMPWYDSRAAEVKSIPLDSFDASTADHRDTDWVYTPQTASNGSFWDWFDRFDWGDSGGLNPGTMNPAFGQIINVILWLIVGFICLALLIWIAWLLMKQEWRWQDSEDETDWLQEPKIDPARFEALPFEVQIPEADLLSLARKAQSEGKNREAMIYLYSYMLLMLDQKHLIHLAKGKTNRTYLRELRGQKAIHKLLEKVVVSFEDVFFGNLALDHDEFQDRWGEVSRFHELIGIQKA